MQKILLIDDEKGIRESLSIMLRMEGYDVTTCEHATTALELIEKGSQYDFIVCDVRLPQMDGITFLTLLREKGIDSVVIMITAYGNIDTSIECIKKGADDYITKPLKTEELILRMKMAEEKKNLKRDNIRLRNKLNKTEEFSDFISASQQVKEIKELALKASQYKTTVLITGESGTGKELLAKFIHENSPRKNKPFIAVNCAAIPATLLESELLGHQKGAFTGANETRIGLIEQANGGTIFLDEIGEIPFNLQSKLLRVLQEQEIRRVGDSKTIKVDVRVIAATNRDLEEEVNKGTFRADLFYRINVLPIKIPPLRERKDDIPILIDHFVKKFNKKLGKNIKGFSPQALSKILKHPWYGNVRELENFVERSMILAESEIIDHIELPGANTKKEESLELWLDTLSLDEAKARIEKAYIEKALEKTKGNRTKAAQVLGISRRNLLYKIKEYLKDNESA